MPYIASIRRNFDKLDFISESTVINIWVNLNVA